ncbi:MAG: alpha-1,2-fucosyltransferase [Candidatus Kerfeldbacteria bacterium]|nr:alpha-1,2-fucosyltransferase [Candidatus Kerfeldbacteria bacterium]
MIITRIIGGLGNQMFQYAAGLALARRYHVPLKLDVRGYDEQKLRQFTLNHFQISAPVASHSELPRMAQTRSPFVRLFPRWYRPGGVKVFRDYLKGFDQTIFLQGGNVYLDGYWQSEQYFVDIAGVVRKEFQLRVPLDIENEKMVEHMTKKPSVSLHVRRGDYVAHPVYATCGIEYYHQAVEYIAARHRGITLYVFSDDPPWVQAHIRTKVPTIYVTNNQGQNDYKDLIVMSRCQHHVIANSSFSWWGAWLAETAGGIVIAPNTWYTDPSMDTSDLLPQRWITLAP